MQTNEGRQAPPKTKPTREDRALGTLMAIWQHGEAARADPVLLNMQARVAADWRGSRPRRRQRAGRCSNG